MSPKEKGLYWELKQLLQMGKEKLLDENGAPLKYDDIKVVDLDDIYSQLKDVQDEWNKIYTSVIEVVKNVRKVQEPDQEE